MNRREDKNVHVFRFGMNATLCAVVCALAACGAKEEAAAPTLDLALEPGMGWRVIDSMHPVITTQVDGIQVDVNATHETTYEIEFTGEVEGEHHFDVTIVRKKLESIVTIDGTGITARDIFGTDPDSQMSRILTGFSFKLIRSPSGSVRAEGDFDSIKNRIRDELDFGRDLSSVPGGRQFRDDAVEDVLLNAEGSTMAARLEPVFGLARGQTLGAGESAVQGPLAHPLLEVVEQRNASLSELGENYAKLALSSTMTPAPGGVDMNIRGGGTGTAEVDLATGVTTRLNRSASLRGTTEEGYVVNAELDERLEVFPR